ncbi:MAG: ATP-binding protein, partial [Syntrophorhabdus sp.]
TAELRESRERFRDLVDLLPQIVFEANKDGYLTYINRLGLETFGFTADDFDRGIHIKDIIAHSDHDRALANFKRRLDGETVGECYEYTVRKKDRTEFPVFIRISSIEDKTGIKGIRGIVVDLTENRKIEAERARLENELRQAQKMEALGTMAGGVAHDFNNILAAIIGFTEMALEDFPEDNPHKRHLERVVKSGLRGRDIVKQMLAFSRKNELALEPVNVNSVLEETLNLLRASIPSTIDIRIRTENNPVIIFANFTHLQQVLINLCNNASDAMSHNGGTLSIEVSSYKVQRNHDIPNLSAGPYVRISVIDNGEGISPGILDRVFEPFFTTKQIGRGTGLGLAVVHGIVTGCGGAITVRSEINRGTRFDVYFPRQENGDPGILSSEPSISGGKEHVLFVDDEDILVDLAKLMIESIGYRVTARTSSREILKIYRENPYEFDIVISDQTMPDMTGYQLAKEMKSIRNIPFILSTGFSYAVDREFAIKAGIDAFIMKPLTKKELARTIRDVLDSRD